MDGENYWVQEHSGSASLINKNEARKGIELIASHLEACAENGAPKWEAPNDLERMRLEREKFASGDNPLVIRITSHELKLREKLSAALQMAGALNGKQAIFNGTVLALPGQGQCAVVVNAMGMKSLTDYLQKTVETASHNR